MSGPWPGECIDVIDGIRTDDSIDEAALGAVARLMRSHGLSPILAEVVADPTASEPMRLRAFGRALVALRSVCPPAADGSGGRCRAIRAASVA